MQRRQFITQDENMTTQEGLEMLSLYTYFRSSASWRVRIVLAHKDLAYESLPIHLLRDGGEQHGAAYATLNPQELVPALMTEQGALAQSLAIIEYLDEIHPEPTVLPGDAWSRAQARSLALQIACDIHPVNNLRILQYLKREYSLEQGSVNDWIHHWIGTGFAALEKQLHALACNGQFCLGNQVTLADACLVPQVFNARRFGVDMTAYPLIASVDAALMALPAFSSTQPALQADAE